MVGLRPKASAFFFALLTNMTLGLTGEGFSQAISVFTGSAQIAAAIVPLVVVLAFLFAGFFIRAEVMPGVVRWGQNLSFLYWGYNALAKNEFAGRGDPISQQILGQLNGYSRWYEFLFYSLRTTPTTVPMRL
jgi:ATP-binding cassette, subfamily G (WHITE), member 2